MSGDIIWYNILCIQLFTIKLINHCHHLSELNKCSKIRTVQKLIIWPFLAGQTIMFWQTWKLLYIFVHSTFLIWCLVFWHYVFNHIWTGVFWLTMSTGGVLVVPPLLKFLRTNFRVPKIKINIIRAIKGTGRQ